MGGGGRMRSTFAAGNVSRTLDTIPILLPWRSREQSKRVFDSGLTERESTAYESLPDLHSHNYRLLSWDMPIDIPELTIPGDRTFKQSNEVTRQRVKMLSLRDEDYFRSFYAIHFCHNPEVLRIYDVQGTRQRDERRRIILGDSYYCVNHPAHYRMMEYRLQREHELQEDTKTKARTVRFSYFGHRRKKTGDPIFKLPEAPITIRSNESRSSLIPISKHLILRTTSSETEMTPGPPKQVPANRLYKQAKVILKNVIQPPGESKDGLLQQLYKTNRLTAFEMYDDMNDDSKSEETEESPSVEQTPSKKKKQP